MATNMMRRFLDLFSFSVEMKLLSIIVDFPSTKNEWCVTVLPDHISNLPFFGGIGRMVVSLDFFLAFNPGVDWEGIFVYLTIFHTHIIDDTYVIKYMHILLWNIYVYYRIYTYIKEYLHIIYILHVCV